MAGKLKIKTIFELMSYKAQNELCLPGCKETQVPWFDPQEGIDWLEVVIRHVNVPPFSREPSPAAVVAPPAIFPVAKGGTWGCRSSHDRSAAR
jgi:hypothetical protein